MTIFTHVTAAKVEIILASHLTGRIRSEKGDEVVQQMKKITMETE